MQRIGLYGGSFNPVHLGHCSSRKLRARNWRCRAHFIPAAQSPFKPGQELAPARNDCVCYDWLAGQTDSEVDDLEIRRGGISYTIDTVRDYASRFPACL
jgi:nicotinate-nucleotide adenylyltransferase